jgi:hypothetical protein
MFEKEIKFISDFCLNKINKAGSFLTFEKLKGIEIHPAILKYISAEMDLQIYKDRQVLLQKSAFDYSGAEISKYFRMIALEIKISKRISENEITDLISQAVTFNFNYMTKPNETLLDFIFKESDSQSPEEMTFMLDYPYYYNYLRQILSSYMEKKQLLTLDKKELEFLLNKIDAELFTAKTNELVDNALEAMSDFFSIGAVVRTQIPPQAIELYLKEKRLNHLVSRLENAITQVPKSKYEIEEIKKIIYSMADTAIPKDEILEPDTSPIESESEKQIEDVSISEDLKSELITIDQDDLLPEPPSLSEIEEIELDDFEITTPNPKDTIDLTKEITHADDTETFSVDTDKVESSSQKKSHDDSIDDNKSGKDILSFLTNREIEKIISSIFNEDKDDFATTIETISECKTYEKATEILKSLYTTYKINPYSRDAILLTNAVAKYFTIA